LSGPTWVQSLICEIRKGTRNGETERCPREDLYWNIIMAGLLGSGLAFLIAFKNQIPIFGEFHLNLKTCLLALAFLVLNHLCLEPLEWKYASLEYKKKIKHFFPHTTEERLLYVPAALIVAFSEEIIFRAVFFSLLYQLTGSSWIAVIVSAIFFSIIHLGWSLNAAGTTFFVGLGLQYLVFISGGLYVAIAVHFIHNLINGIIYGRLTNAAVDKHALPISEEVKHI